MAFIWWGSSTDVSKKEYAEIFNFEEVSVDTSSSDSSFTIITYNLGYLSGMTNNTGAERQKENFKKNFERVKKTFLAYKPDFIGLQEVDFKASRSFEVNQMEELSKALNLPWAAKAVNWDKKYVPFPYFPPTQHFGKMLSGQAILSKYPIRLHDRIVLKRPPNPFWYDAFYIDRLAQIGTIQVGNHEVIVINVHLEAWQKETRTEQAQAVLELFKSYAAIYPTLLIGDFNSEPPFSKEKNPSLDVFLKEPKLKAACPDKDFRRHHTFTFPSENPTQQIDFIFYHEDQVEMLDWKVIHEAGMASDHLPVLMKFKLK